MKTNVCILALLGTSLLSQAQMTTQVLTPAQAVEVLLGDGIVATNITYSGSQEQIGSFVGENCNIGLPSGMVLSTGHVNVGIGPNTAPDWSNGGGNFGATDPDIDALDVMSDHHDAAILEFDFVASGDSVSFSYVFASEEYPEFVDLVNDVFGFFLSGPGIDGPFLNDAVNIAVLPGSGDVVSINTINNGNSGINGPCVNCEYYIHNGTGGSDPWASDDFYVQFDGFTTTLTAKAAVQCGETYHIKIAIADASDTDWDSSVFLEAGSFTSNAPSIVAGVSDPSPSLPPFTVVEGCVDGFFTIFHPDPDTEQTIQLSVSGTATEGTDYSAIPAQVILPVGEPSVTIPVEIYADASSEQQEDITIRYFYVNNCGEQDTASASLFIRDYIPMTLALDDVFICPSDQAEVSAAPQGGLSLYTYEWSHGEEGEVVTFTSGEEGAYSVTVSDHCGESITVPFEVQSPAPFAAPDSIGLCVSQWSDRVVTGGATPYAFVYDESALEFVAPASFRSSVPGVYQVVVTDACGQEVSVDLHVTDCATLIPNVFTPNGDEENEYFRIAGIEGFPESKLTIYDRWGGVIYSSDDYRNNWRGSGLAEGVYYYVFLRSDGEDFHGYVHLLR